MNVHVYRSIEALECPSDELDFVLRSSSHLLSPATQFLISSRGVKEGEKQ